MVHAFKDFFFFPVASYFAFWAKIRLKKWNPRVIVITGSSGKTTLFSLIEAQLGNVAHYSHHANSAIGIPFDILGLHRKTLKPLEWIGLFLKAPSQAFKEPYEEKLYVAECDADRPGEGRFLSKLLNPEVTLWVSSSRTHSMNFDKLIPFRFERVEDAIAYEFGNFVEKTSKLVIVDGDSDLMLNQEKRTKAEVKKVNIKDLTDYKIGRDGTEFEIKNKIKVKFKALLPKEIFYSIEMTRLLCEYLGIQINPNFPDLKLPPARSSLFRGVKNITIIDSTYNANLSSMQAIISMFKVFPAKNKWGVFGDMLEQGREEQEEHEKLADLIAGLDLERIILLGPRVRNYTYPILKEKIKDTPIDVFENPKDVLDLLLMQIKGGETVLFKGARFLEGVIENLLLNKKEKSMLTRREKIWEERRRKWGL